MIDETGRVTFSEAEQAEVNRVVQDRLAREQGKYEGHEDLKGIQEELKAFGYAGTPSEIRATIRAQREETQRQTELSQLQEQARTQGTSPELLGEIKELKKELAEIKQKSYLEAEQEAKRVSDNAKWNSQVAEMTAAYPDVNLNELPNDPKFARFAKGKHDPLKEIYDDYLELIGETKSDATSRAASKEMRSTGSGKGGAPISGSAHGLTESQKQLVDEWNEENSNPKLRMTYKQYADKL